MARYGTNDRMNWERNWRGEANTPDMNYNAGYEGLEAERRALREGGRGGGSRGGGFRGGDLRGSPSPRGGFRERGGRGYDSGYGASRMRFVPGDRQGGPRGDSSRDGYGRDSDRQRGGFQGARSGYDGRFGFRGGGLGMGHGYDRGW